MDDVRNIDSHQGGDMLRFGLQNDRNRGILDRIFALQSVPKFQRGGNHTTYTQEQIYLIAIATDTHSCTAFLLKYGEVLLHQRTDQPGGQQQTLGVRKEKGQSSPKIRSGDPMDQLFSSKVIANTVTQVFLLLG